MAKQSMISLRVDPHLCVLENVTNFYIAGCDNILSGYLCAVTTVFSQQDGIYGFNSSKGFWRSLAEISLFFTLFFNLII